MSLKELLGEELYNQVVEKAGDNKLAIVSDGNWFPKDKFDAKNQEVKSLQDQVKERDNQLNALKDVNPEELKQEIAELQKANKTKDTEHAAELKDLQLTSAIKLALNGQVHDDEIASGLIDKEKLVISDDGKIVGLDEQVTTLKESKPFLFKAEDEGEPGNPNFSVGEHQRSGGINPFSKENFNLTEQSRLFKENPAKYKQFKAQAE